MTTIYYFTGTGNSLWLARQLAKEISGETEVFSIAKAFRNDKPVCSSEKLVIIFPVYCFCPPRIVSEFLQKIIITGNPHITLLANPASQMGGAITAAEKILKERGQKVALAACIKMPGNYPPLSGAESESKQQKKFTTARKEIVKLANEIENGNINSGGRGLFVFKYLQPLFNAMLGKMLHRGEKKFFVAEDCTSCGLCASVCPVDNIDMIAGKPVWQGHCEQCMACLQFCPTEAIQNGNITRERKRYHHPEVSAEDMKSME